MENKKLYKYLLNDLSELEELFAEKKNGCFDELEMEFLKTRVKGVKRLIGILSETDDQPQDSMFSEEIEVREVEPSKPEYKEPAVAESFVEPEPEPQPEEIKEPEQASPAEVVIQPNSQPEPESKVPEEIQPVKLKEEEPKQAGETENATVQNSFQVKEEIPERKNKTLGDSFSKEKSINDLGSGDATKLEHKLSNRPVQSIKTAIGINDRFQYIRELFEGKADEFSKTVDALDGLQDINEAVEYLQKNFEWKKNETSLKFINLVKRRFSNE